MYCTPGEALPNVIINEGKLDFFERERRAAGLENFELVKMGKAFIFVLGTELSENRVLCPKFFSENNMAYKGQKFVFLCS